VFTRQCNTAACPVGAGGTTFVCGWSYGTFSICDKTCGGGTQTRTVTCKDAEHGVVIADSLCEFYVAPKPAVTQTCNTQPCSGGQEMPTFSWNTFDWLSCNVNCGSGSQYLEVRCNNDATGQHVHDANCLYSVGPKPVYSRPCNTQECVPVNQGQEQGDYACGWSTGTWSTCSNSIQVRTVTCTYIGSTGILSDSLCIQLAGPKPSTQQSCISPSASTVHFRVGGGGRVVRSAGRRLLSIDDDDEDEASSTLNSNVHIAGCPPFWSSLQSDCSD
jgi:hypothetical protein